jgi:5'(3')-deoxyribonucleotidase
VTAYVPSTCIDKSFWLKEYMNFFQDDIVFCNKKHRISADIMIDDGAHNLENFKGVRVLFSSPHNESCKEEIFNIRVDNYEELEKHFISLGWL